MPEIGDRSRLLRLIHNYFGGALGESDVTRVSES